MKSITTTLDNKYSEPQKCDKTYNVMDHIDSSRSVEYQAVGSNIYIYIYILQDQGLK